MLTNKERKKEYTKKYKVPIEDFKSRFSWLFKRMESFEDLDGRRLFINLDNGKTMIYDILFHTVKEVKRFDDISELTEEEWKIGFSNLLRKQIRSKGITQYELANRLGVTEMTISRYTTGKSLPSVYMLDKIIRVLNCSTEDLYPHDYIELE